MRWLYELLCFGDPTNGQGAIHSIHFPRLDTPLMRLVFLAVLAFAVWAVIALYRREAAYVALARKRLLASLRIGAWVVVLFILSGAFLELTRAEDATGSVLLLIDQSHSKGIADTRTDPDDIHAALAIVGKEREGELSKLTRHDLVQAAFARSDLDPVRALAGRFHFQGFMFGRSATVTPFELQDAAQASGPLGGLAAPTDDATQLGSAILDASRRTRGTKVDAMVVVSDGGSNRGEDPVEAAKQAGCPVYTIGVGPPQAKDVEIPFIYCEDVVFKNDRFPLNVRIKQRGYTGRDATLHIKRIDEQRVEEVVREMPVDFDDQLERMVTVDVLPDKEGVFTYVAELEPFADEADKLNNIRAKPNVRVVDKKIRVLMVDDSPRYVWRFVKAILDGDKQRIAPTFLLRQGDPPKGSHQLTHFPENAQDMRNFDVVILGDVPAQFLNANEIKVLDEFVRKEGGGLIAIAGRNHFPADYLNTPIAEMLPVELEAVPAPSPTEDLSRTLKSPWKPALTAEGSSWPALRFSPDAAENQKDWQVADPLLWLYPTRKIKPLATVLITHPDRSMPDGAKMPVLASQRFGKGHVLYFATDEIWRWRFHPGASEHRRLWGQVVSALAMSRLIGSSDKAQLDTDRPEYSVGDHAQIVAHLLDNDYNPIGSDSVPCTIERELSRETVMLSARKDQPGVFSGEWIPTSEGKFRISVESGGETAEKNVAVTNPRIEFEDIGQHQELLARLSQASGGAYFPLEKLDQLTKELSSRQHEAHERRGERTLWNAPGVMVLLVLFLGAEWFLRKRSDLL